MKAGVEKAFRTLQGATRGEENSYRRRRAAGALYVRSYKSYESLEAKDGYSGIQISLAEHPDLIRLDLGLPGMSGMDTAKKIKENPQTNHIPIIALSAYEPRQFEAKARQVGIAAYLQKPVSIANIVAKIETFIRPNASHLCQIVTAEL